MDLFKNQPGLALNKINFNQQVKRLKTRNKHGIVNLDQNVAQLQTDLFKSGSTDMDVQILNSF